MKKEYSQTVTKYDLNIQQTKPNQHPISTEVISDGKIITQNLQKLNLNQQWLEQQLKMSGIDSISDVFYAEVLKNGTLYVDKKMIFYINLGGLIKFSFFIFCQN